MSREDETRQSFTSRSTAPFRRPRAWIRWLANTSHAPTHSELSSAASPDSEQLSVHATLRALPTLLDSSSLPNGVVELLIEDFETPIRQLFDIHDGRVTLVEPGKCVPWASIAGPLTAWELALGPTRDTAGLQLTGDERLARRVLAALRNGS